MKRRLTSILLAVALVSLLPLSAGAALLASWDFETINGAAAVDGQTMSNGGTIIDVTDGDSITDGSGNGNDLKNYADGQYQVSANIGGNATLAGHKLNSWDGTQTQSDLLCPNGNSVGALATWEISVDVYFVGDDIGNWRTMVGKDGYGQGGAGAASPGDANAAALYVQKTWDNYFRVNFADSADNRWILDSNVVAVADQWYSVTASSDGSTLSLDVDGDVTTLDISASLDSSMVALQIGEVAGPGPDDIPYGWSVGRGMYNDGHGDKMTGYLDNVVISGEGVCIPEPASLVLFGLGGLALATRRR